MTTATTTPVRSLAVVYDARFSSALDRVIRGLHAWLVENDYAGYEPYDLLNSPALQGWAHHQPFATFFIQGGRRLGGIPLRRFLRVPPSRNPKALGLVLSAYCDLTKIGWKLRAESDHIRRLLLNLRSHREEQFCWGYDWHYVSLRGARLPAFSPNSVATVFCAEGFLDHADVFRDPVSREIAASAAEWLVTCLQRSVYTREHICFSYTPHDRTRIFNNSALIGALLARLAGRPGCSHYREIARQVMQFLVNGQASDGSWPYGLARSQRWIDSFHTGYNLCALLAYQRLSDDDSFAEALARGYNFYQHHLFRSDGAPRYLAGRNFPVDIHACAQAILTLCDFSQFDPSALRQAHNIARWTTERLLNADGSFGYQLRRFRKDSTPYVRWSQAWMLRALARLRLLENSRA